jgi:hypothetical protein
VSGEAERGSKSFPKELFSSKEDGWNGSFIVPIDGDMWHIRISDGGGWRHLSISNMQRKVMPTWQIMCRAKELFWGDDELVVQYHPPKSDYINDHPFCLHLWQCLDEPMPAPPWVFV